MTGVWTFLRTFAWRSRWTVLAWAVGIALLYVSQAISVDDLYVTQAELDRAAASMQNNVAFIALAGPPRALDTTGGQVMWQSAAFGALLVGLMSMFVVGRRTRAEEESGRDELLRAAPVGRLAPATAALLTSLAANVVVGASVAASLVGYGLAGADSVATGVGLTLVGWFFTASALLAAQLTSSTRGTYGLSGLVIGVAYGLRAVGDLGNGVASWLSPIGWYQAMHPYSGLRWWPGLLLLVGSGAVTAVAYVVFERRDYGAGVLSARPGPARAAATLGSGLGLAWRLQRSAVLAWTGALLLCGLVYGSMGNDVEGMIGRSQVSRDMFAQGGGTMVEAFYATIMLVLVLIVGAYTISSTMRPRAEEDQTHAEILLSTGLSRRRWLLGHVMITVAGTVAGVVAGGAGLTLGYAIATGSVADLTRYSLPIAQYLPGVLLLAALARLLYGVAPRWMALAWVPLGWAFVVALFGDVWHLPQWLQDLSPFERLALVPVRDVDWPPVLALAALAATLSVAGQIAFRRRDVH